MPRFKWKRDGEKYRCEKEGHRFTIRLPHRQGVAPRKREYIAQIDGKNQPMKFKSVDAAKAYLKKKYVELFPPKPEPCRHPDEKIIGGYGTLTRYECKTCGRIREADSS